MAFVGLVSEAQADPRVQELYQQVRQNFGFLPNYFQALGRDAQVIEGQLALASAIMKERALPAALKEQIGLVVSGINSSSYCIAIHMEMLRQMGVEKPLARKLATDYPSAPVGEKEKVLFRLADKLTRKPFDVGPADVDAVRRAGWDDAAVVEAVLAVSHFNFLNRVSAGLGLVADF